MQIAWVVLTAFGLFLFGVGVWTPPDAADRGRDIILILMGSVIIALAMADALAKNKP